MNNSGFTLKMKIFKNQKFKERALKVLGYVVLFAGVEGLFLPFFQGILFMTVGFYIISLASPDLKKKLVIQIKKRTWFPDFVDKLDKAIENFINKL